MWTFQFIYTNQDANNRVHAPYWSDIEDLVEAIKDAKEQAAEIGAKIGVYLRGHHARLS